MPILPFPEDRLRCIANEDAVELVDITANARLLDEFDHHERIVKGICPTTGLQAVIAIHDRTLGPALGGCRMWPYESEREAVIDALRLAKSMTLKAAVAGPAILSGSRCWTRTARPYSAPSSRPSPPIRRRTDPGAPHASTGSA